MSRTQNRLDADTPQSDGQLPIPGTDFVNTNASVTTYSKIAFGEYSLHCATSATAYQAVGGLNATTLRTGVQDALQELYGSYRAGGAQGLPVGIPLTYATAAVTVPAPSYSQAVVSSVGMSAGQSVTLDTVASGKQEFTTILSVTNATTIVLANVTQTHSNGFPIFVNNYTTPAGVSGFPPYTGLSQLTPVVSARPKGIKITQVTLNYLVGTANISAQTVGLAYVTYANGVAAAVTTLIANATNALPVAFGATPYAWVIPVPIANQVWINPFNSFVSVEFDFTTGTSGTVDVLGATLSCQYNFN